MKKAVRFLAILLLLSLVCCIPFSSGAVFDEPAWLEPVAEWEELSENGYVTSRLKFEDVPDQLMEALVPNHDRQDAPVPIDVDMVTAEDLNCITIVNDDGTKVVHGFSGDIKYIDEESGEIRYIDHEIKQVGLWENLTGTAKYRSSGDSVQVTFPKRIQDGVEMQRGQDVLLMYRK